MPANTVTIIKPDGSQTEYDLFAGEVTRESAKPDLGRFDLLASATPDPETDIQPGADRIQATGPDNRLIFGGLVGDVEKDGQLVEVIADGVEALADIDQPGPPLVVRDTRSDATLIKDALDRSALLSAGTIDTLADPVKVTFQHARPSEVIRTLQKQTGAFVSFEDDFTIDYRDPANVSRDRTATTLTPTDGSFAFDSVRQEGATGADVGKTHWRALGDGRGGRQLRVNLVPDDDGEGYENKITYANPDWSAGDVERWAVIQDRSITTEIELREFVRQERRRRTRERVDGVTVSGSVYQPLDLELFDRVTVDLPDNGTVNNEVLEVTALTRKITTGGHYLEVGLTERNEDTFPVGEPGEVERITASLENYARTQPTTRNATKQDAITRRLAERPN